MFFLFQSKIYIPISSVSMISIYVSVLGFVQLSVVVTLVSQNPYGRKCFSVKAANECILLTVNCK